MTRQSLGAIVFAAIVLAGCGGEGQSGHNEGGSSAANAKLLRVTKLQGTVVRMGSLRGEPLLGLQVRAHVCSRSAAEADRTYPASFRIAHHVTAGRAAASRWQEPFRVTFNELSWLVPLGEGGGACNGVEFEEVIPPANYGGLESPLGCLGYCRNYRCYGIQFTLRAGLLDKRKSTPMSASRRNIIQCGRFRRSLLQSSGK